MTYQAKDTMTRKIITIPWDSSLMEAYQLMKKNKIRHLPVTKSDSGVVGLLSDRDIQRAMRSDFTHDGLVPLESSQFPEGAKVRDYMNWPTVTVDKKQDLESVVLRMLKEKISSVLVADGAELVGIITTDDLLHVLAKLLKDGKDKKFFGVEEFLEEHWVPLNTLV